VIAFASAAAGELDAVKDGHVDGRGAAAGGTPRRSTKRSIVGDHQTCRDPEASWRGDERTQEIDRVTVSIQGERVFDRSIRSMTRDADRRRARGARE
jgi:hypothetical protein